MIVADANGAAIWRLWGLLERAALATLGSRAWRELWRRDGDSAVWARVLSFVSPL
jgi:hypothetical protein